MGICGPILSKMELVMGGDRVIAASCETISYRVCRLSIPLPAGLDMGNCWGELEQGSPGEIPSLFCSKSSNLLELSALFTPPPPVTLGS